MKSESRKFMIDSIEKALAVDAALKEWLQRTADKETDPNMKAAIEKQIASWDWWDETSSKE